MSQDHKIGDIIVKDAIPAGLQSFAKTLGVDFRLLHRHKVMSVISHLSVKIDQLGDRGLTLSDLRDHPDIMQGFAQNTRAFVPVEPDLFKRALVETMKRLVEQARGVVKKTPEFEKDGHVWPTLWTVAGEEREWCGEHLEPLRLFYSTAKAVEGPHPQVDPKF